MFEDLNLKKKDKYYLLGILIFSTILTAYYIDFNLKIGISCSDVYVYLLNALYYTGTNIRAESNIFLSPIICFLTSLLFRAGLTNQIAIYLVTATFAVLGNIGLYILFRQYFDESLSLAGTVIYTTLSLNLTWLANGTLDIPAVAVTIWIVLFTLTAINKNPKYYAFAIPLFTIGFFTRYTVILTAPALLLYYIYENGFKIKETDKKYIIIGIIFGLLIGIIIFATIYTMGQGQFEASSQMANGIAGKQGSNTDPAYNTELGYYLRNFPNFISNSHTVFDGNPILENPTIISWGILAILAVGAALWLRENKLKFEKKDILPIIIFLIAIVTYTRISSVITTFIVLIGLYLIGKNSKNKTGYLMAAWILANFIFFSYYSIKVNRYIIPVFPAFTYFILKAVQIIHDTVKINKNIIPIILIIIFAIQGFAYTQAFEPTDVYTSTEQISNFIIDNNPNYQDIPIGTYNIRPYLWWIGENVGGIPISNKTAIDNSNLTYYIANKKLDDLQNYTEIKNINNLYLYKNKAI